MKIFWFIPSHGDGRYLGTAIGGRTTSHDYLTQIARAVDSLGYYGALLPTGRSCEDAWVTASSLFPHTKRMRFLVALRPGLMSPGLAARMAATFDRLSGGRLLLNVVTGGDPEELAGDGVHLSHDDRYRLTDEFLHIFRKTCETGIDRYDGEFLKVVGSKLLFEPLQRPYPPLYFGGSSKAAIDIAAKHVQVYLTWGEPVAAVKEKVDIVRERAAKEGRSVEFGIRLHVIVRETDREAWADAERLIRHVDEATIRASQLALAKHDSEGQRRMRELHNGSRQSLEISPNLWAGVGLVRGGAGTALVGSAETVAERMEEYRAVGIESFIFSGYPHLEEAYQVADLLFPKLPIEAQSELNVGIVGDQLSGRHRVGEVIGNAAHPEVKHAAN